MLSQQAYVPFIPLAQAVVHISTAYSNAEKRVVEEKVYPPPADPAAVMEFCDNFDDEAVAGLADGLMQSRQHPNTYTLTKAMAEWIVSQQAHSFPTAIVRPSIGENPHIIHLYYVLRSMIKPTIKTIHK